MQLYCSSQPTVGYYCFRYKFYVIFLRFPLPSFPSSGQQLCLPIRTDEFQLCLASNPAFYPRTYSSTSSDLLLSMPFYIYWLILLILQFFLLDVLLRLIFFPYFFSNLSIFLPYVVCSTFLTSILSLRILFSLFFSFFLPFLSRLCRHYLCRYLYVCLFMLSILCF